MNSLSMNSPVNAIDMSVLVSLESAQADNEPDLIVDLIDIYLEDTPRRLAAMWSLYEQRDMVLLRREAHGLKGSSATIGLARTAELCEAVEQIAQECWAAGLADLLSELKQQFALVREAFLAERGRRTSRARNGIGRDGNARRQPHHKEFVYA